MSKAFLKAGLLSKSLGSQVYARLQEMGLLEGLSVQNHFFACIAGQAVSSIVDHILWGVLGPINDVDVFVSLSSSISGKMQYIEKLQSNKNTFFAKKLEFSINTLSHDYLPFSVVLEATQNYRILGVDRKGPINRVYVDLFDAKFEGTCSESLTSLVINGFDINCTQVGIDLATKNLVWTKAYEKFVYSRQLEMCQVHTPAQTLSRILKKSLELDSAYLSVKDTLDTCAAIALSSWFSVMQKQKLLSASFGEKTKERLELVRPLWENHFKIEPVILAGRPTLKSLKEGSSSPCLRHIPAKKDCQLWELIPTYTPDVEVLRLCEKQGVAACKYLPAAVTRLNAANTKSFDSFVRKNPELALFGAKRSGEVFTTLLEKTRSVPYASPYKKHPLESRVCHFAPEFNKTSCTIGELHGFGAELNSLGSLKVIGAFLTLDPYGYFDKSSGYSESQLKEVDNYLQQHGSLVPVLSNLTFCVQLRIVRQLKELCQHFNTEGVVGLIYREPFLFDLLLNQDFVPLRQAIATRFENAQKDYTSRPLKFEKFIASNGLVVKEVFYALDLMAEGSHLHHCVGGYAKSVGEGQSRIISVIDPANQKNRATAELVIQTIPNNFPVTTHPARKIIRQNIEIPSISVTQLRSFCNSIASDSCKQATREFVSWFVENFKSIYEDNFLRNSEGEFIIPNSMRILKESVPR